VCKQNLVHSDNASSRFERYKRVAIFPKEKGDETYAHSELEDLQRRRVSRRNDEDAERTDTRRGNDDEETINKSHHQYPTAPRGFDALPPHWLMRSWTYVLLFDQAHCKEARDRDGSAEPEKL